MKKESLLLCCLVGVNLMTKADVGCVPHTNNTIIYMETNGGGNQYKGSAVGVGCTAVPSTNPKTSCNIQGVAGNDNGYLANYPQNCDIDTNVFFLLFGTVGFGLFTLNRKTSLAIKWY